MRRCLLLVVVAALSLGFAPAPLPRRAAPATSAADDLKAMQGAWVLRYSIKNGRWEQQAQEAVWLVEGDRVSTTLDGKKGSQFFISLNSKTSPRSIDIRSTRESAPVSGCYSVAGDTLRVCLGQPRPRDLSGNGTENGVWVFKRR
jgi:uncharacterized protein (TIGR03067 family)